MLSKAQCIKIINETEISDEYFLRLHFCVEAVIKRLFLIGLRLQGVQFAIAKKIVEEYPMMGLKKQIKKVFGYCNIDYNKHLTSGNYAQLETLFFEFTSRHRNRRVHGLSPAIVDKELLKLLINADKKFIMEIEATIKALGKPSVFDTPKKWGADYVTDKTASTVFTNLFGRENPELPLPEEKVAEILKGIK